jgi:hypothetical protein
VVIPFVKKQRALSSLAMGYKKATSTSAWNTANMQMRSADTDTGASAKKNECAEMIRQTRQIEIVVDSGLYIHWGPVKSELASARSVANARK